jgi:hypothetical protein
MAGESGLTEPSAVTAELERAFERACGALGRATRWLTIGGRRVEVRLAGSRLETTLRALGHLETGAAAPAFTLCVADTETSGVEPRLALQQKSAARERIGAPRSISLPSSRALYHYDPERRLGFCWYARATLEPWERAAPFRPLLAWWAADLGAQLAHAAVVGNGHSVIVFAGPGGSGKSTLTLGCLRRGLRTLGDDYVWLEPGRPWSAHSLYCSVRLVRGDWHADCGGFYPDPGDATDDKLAAFLPAVLGAHPPAAPIRAVAALRIADRSRPRVRRASPVQVLAALAPSSLLQLPGSGPSGLAQLARLVRETPALLFEAGADHAANAEAVAALVDDLSRPERPSALDPGAPP